MGPKFAGKIWWKGRRRTVFGIGGPLPAYAQDPEDLVKPLLIVDVRSGCAGVRRVLPEEFWRIFGGDPITLGAPQLSASPAGRSQGPHPSPS